MNEKLKPCPLCGANVKVQNKYRLNNGNIYLFYIQCTCGLNLNRYRHTSECEKEILESVIKKWNTRTKQEINMKTKEEILNHNLKAVCEIKRLQKEIDVLKNKQRGMRNAMIPPCEHCPYDGVYRCEACQRDNYAGFNVKDYPRGY